MEKNTTPNIRGTAYKDFQENGFCLTPVIYPEDLVHRAIAHMDAVKDGEYETGIPPVKREWNPGDDPLQLCKINEPHISDRTIYELITFPALGRWAAAVTGASMVQVWAAQLLFKPPGGSSAGTVGWHQDYQYWGCWDKNSEVFTAWTALSDVRENAGPMVYVRGTHGWGFRNEGDFFGTNNEQLKAGIYIPDEKVWEEVPAVLKPGAVSFHDKFTFHGSAPNTSDLPRRSFAVHLRTEKSEPYLEGYYFTDLNDPSYCPVIYEK